MREKGTLLLGRGDVAALLGLDECTAAVERAFKAHAEGRALAPGVLGVRARNGGFHIKAAGLELARPYFAAKLNGNFFQNKQRFGMPNIQGVVALCDAENGYPLAVMDSIEITIIRTGAATAVAAKYLARASARVVTICGCGNQGRVSLAALAKVRPIEKAYAFDIDHARAERFAGMLSNELRIEVKAVRDLAGAVGKSDICVTCTPATEHYLNRSDVAPGTFIAAVGADNEEKQELDPHLVAAGKVVVDSLEQCAVIGDLKLALALGLMTKADAHAELGEVIAGRRPGRESREEIIIFDSTGTALQDVAAAAVVYEKAVNAGIGITLNFAA
ncbi:MAG TPA: ornithine cyclodeaminase family protein [Blastocatellia bacterium]|nr:ornithine cyclodeaminase family protein [Blastocatellia bacterium]